MFKTASEVVAYIKENDVKFLDVRFTANRVSGHTDKATNPRFDDHKISASSKVPKANGGHST